MHSKAVYVLPIGGIIYTSSLCMSQICLTRLWDMLGCVHVQRDEEIVMATYGYLRVSTEGKGQTTDNQHKQIADAGFAVEQYFSEDGVSGSIKAFSRPAFSKMLKQAKDGDTII